ncbi:MAG TPA: hypothetical protein VH228_18725 [Nocardioides sp.]|nr:hypothetical protein [Nocardioides sp.]
MPVARILVPALGMVLAGCLAGCGNGDSSSSEGASKADFCRTFNQLGADTSPQRAADELSRVGTPSDIGAGARRGFDVLVDHLRQLRPGADPGEVTTMVKGLHAQDAADVRAFITYYATECQGLSGDSSS